MTQDYLPCRPDEWLCRLAEGWHLAGVDTDPLPIADFIEWNNGWPVVLLVREVAE